MHYQIAEVQQHPAARGRALGVAQIMPLRLEVLFEVLGQRAKLGWGLRRGDYEVVGETRHARNVDQRDVERLAVGQDIDGPLGQ